MHMRNSSVNMKRMMRSTVCSTWERFEGGWVEFMKILVSWPGERVWWGLGGRVGLPLPVVNKAAAHNHNTSTLHNINQKAIKTGPLPAPTVAPAYSTRP
jgi:hypothetical protein